MISAESFVKESTKYGFTLWTGVPCSYLKPFINYVIDAPDLDYIGATNEGDAVAIASGADMGGRPSVVMFQNSGFGNTVNPLTSLNMIFDIPTLIETCSRGITLYPGDVIATGSPAGVGMGFDPPKWLHSGDVVRIEIDGIGAIENRFV